MGVSLNGGTPKTPMVVGYPYFWKHPYMYIKFDLLSVKDFQQVLPCSAPDSTKASIADVSTGLMLFGTRKGLLFHGTLYQPYLRKGRSPRCSPCGSKAKEIAADHLQISQFSIP